MKYTTERPTVPGYYWLKWDGNEEIVKVREWFGKLEVHEFLVPDTDSPTAFKNSCQWAGPIDIEKPED